MDSGIFGFDHLHSSIAIAWMGNKRAQSGIFRKQETEIRTPGLLLLGFVVVFIITIYPRSLEWYLFLLSC